MPQGRSRDRQTDQNLGAGDRRNSSQQTEHDQKANAATCHGPALRKVIQLWRMTVAGSRVPRIKRVEHRLDTDTWSASSNDVPRKPAGLLDDLCSRVRRRHTPATSQDNGLPRPYLLREGHRSVGRARGRQPHVLDVRPGRKMRPDALHEQRLGRGPVEADPPDLRMLREESREVVRHRRGSIDRRSPGCSGGCRTSTRPRPRCLPTAPAATRAS